MALISETCYGGDPNNKPEELHKNPPEEEEIENLAPIPRQIPDDLIGSTVANVRRCHYPKLSLISRSFRRVISSQELFVTRSHLRLTEPVLYTLITFLPFDNASWFILHRSKISLRLSEITSLPPMFPGSTAVTIGHKIYVIGGYNKGFRQRVKTVIVIDCRFHTYRQLRSMQKGRCYAAAGVIDRKIYVVGGRNKRYDDDWVEVFDVENEIWETVPGPYSSVASLKEQEQCPIHVVMDNKIYMLDCEYCFTYDPRQRTWETWGPESQQRLFWHASSCVVDDLLYAIDTGLTLGSPIVVYDPRVMVWRPVKGINFWPGLVYTESRMANFGGNLVVLGCYQSRLSCDNYLKINVWCVEVALEKREDGDIWGMSNQSGLCIHSPNLLSLSFLELLRFDDSFAVAR